MKIETRYNIAIVVAVAAIVAAFAASAAPTANEDYVDRQDAQTYTNAVTDAGTYTDAATNGAVTAARSLANAAKTGAVAQANAYTDAAVADAKPSDYDTVKAKAESAVQPADLEPYCTIEAARRMTNGVPVVTKATVTGWGFLESFTESDPTFAAWLATDPLAGCGTPDDYDTVKANAAAGAAAASQVEELGGQIQSAYLYSMGVYNYMSGNTNAWWSGTNYVFGADAAARTRFAWSPDMDAATVPCSMALWEIRDGVRQCVWDQRDWPTWYWNYVSAKFRQEVAASNAVLSAAITNRAPRAWSGTTAATGLDNPDRSTTWVDTPTLTLAPGMAWETVAHVGGCGYWGIVGDGTVIGGSGTNATLEIRDFEGKTVMRVIKGDSRLVYLECGSDIYTSGYDAQGRVTFTMRSDTQPVGEFSTVLDTALFVGEDNANCPVDYEWETVTPGAVYRCHFLVKSGIDADSCFARFKAMRNENTRIEYAADQVISGGLIYSGVKIAPVIPSNVSVGDTISWKVIAK